LTKEKPRKARQLIVGGLHRDDFEWAAQRYEETGYVLVAFLLDCDCYHWKAVYVNVETLQKPRGEGAPVPLRLCPSLEVQLVNGPVSR
jgi:hypothetical protein